MTGERPKPLDDTGIKCTDGFAPSHDWFAISCLAVLAKYTGLAKNALKKWWPRIESNNRYNSYRELVLPLNYTAIDRDNRSRIARYCRSWLTVAASAQISQTREWACEDGYIIRGLIFVEVSFPNTPKAFIS